MSQPNQIPRPDNSLSSSAPVVKIEAKGSGIVTSSTSATKLSIGERISRVLDDVKEKKKPPYMMDQTSQLLFVKYFDEVAE
jgi:hypothetical protein